MEHKVVLPPATQFRHLARTQEGELVHLIGGSCPYLRLVTADGRATEDCGAIRHIKQPDFHPKISQAERFALDHGYVLPVWGIVAKGLSIDFGAMDCARDSDPMEFWDGRTGWVEYGPIVGGKDIRPDKEVTK